VVRLEAILLSICRIVKRVTSASVCHRCSMLKVHSCLLSIRRPTRSMVLKVLQSLMTATLSLPTQATTASRSTNICCSDRTCINFADVKSKSIILKSESTFVKSESKRPLKLPNLAKKTQDNGHYALRSTILKSKLECESTSHLVY